MAAGRLINALPLLNACYNYVMQMRFRFIYETMVRGKGKKADSKRKGCREFISWNETSILKHIICYVINNVRCSCGLTSCCFIKVFRILVELI